MRAVNMTLTATVKELSTTLANVTDDCGPDAPSLACVYWLYGPTRWTSKSWVAEQNRLKPLIRHIGDLPAMKLTPLAWAQHAARRKLEPHAKGSAPADHLLNLELARAKQLLSWGVANKLLKYNPLTPAKKVPAITRRETWLPLHGVDRLLAACDDVVDKRLTEGDDDGLRAKVLRAFVLCLHDPMLRFMEAMSVILRPARIRPDGRVELASRDVKGGKRRTVFLTPRAMEAVEDLPPAFVSGERKVGRRTLARWFRDLCVQAGVDTLVAPGEKRVRPHDLRASAASTADEKGARSTAIRDTLGHAQLSTTEIYLRSGQAQNARDCTELMTKLTGRRRRPALRAPRSQMPQSTAGRAKILASRKRDR